MARKTTKRGDVLVPPTDGRKFLRRLGVEAEVDTIADVAFCPLMNKDSTNMVPADWTVIATAIHEKRDEGFDGFVIAHGTDTMHFSSSALSFAFGGNLNFPIVLTGAQTTPDIAHGDARVNLLRAIKTAATDLAEVVITFGDYVFRGCCVQKKDEKRFDAFESPAALPLGHVTQDILLAPHARRRSRDRGEIDFRPDFADGIIQISLIPGLRPDLLRPVLDNEACRGIVLQSFGAGNVPNEGEYSFETFIRGASERGIPVLIASQFSANSTLGSHYAPGIAAIDAGAIPTGNMTNAAVTVKFRWVLSQMERQGLTGREMLGAVRRLMNHSFVGELTSRDDG